MGGKGPAKRENDNISSSGIESNGKRRKLHSDDEKSYKDFICPICLELLIEPVELPCQHELCLGCFNPYLENTSLVCPICRERISIWARKNRKANTLVNVEHWDLIKKRFPDRVNRRMGISNDDSLSDSSPSFYDVPTRIIANDGEIRKEFEEERKKVELENLASSEASVEYINKILKEEEARKKELEEKDRIAAFNLQKEEMENSSGKQLQLPRQHKHELINMFKRPAMKLRSRSTSTTTTVISDNEEKPKNAANGNAECSSQACS